MEQLPTLIYKTVLGAILGRVGASLGVGVPIADGLLLGRFQGMKKGAKPYGLPPSDLVADAVVNDECHGYG